MKNKIYKIIMLSIFSFNLQAMEDSNHDEKSKNIQFTKEIFLENKRKIIFEPLDKMHEIMTNTLTRFAKNLPENYSCISLQVMDKLYFKDYPLDSHSKIQNQLNFFLEKANEDLKTRNSCLKIRKKPCNYDIPNQYLDEVKGNQYLFILRGKNQIQDNPLYKFVVEQLAKGLQAKVLEFSREHTNLIRKALLCSDFSDDLDKEIEPEKFKKYFTIQTFFILSRIYLGDNKLPFNYDKLLEQSKKRNWADYTFELNKNVSGINFLQFNIIQSILLQNQQKFILSILKDSSKDLEKKKNSLLLFAIMPELLNKNNPDELIRKDSFSKNIGRISNKIYSQYIQKMQSYDFGNKDINFKGIDFFEQITQNFANDQISISSIQQIAESLKLNSEQTNQIYEIFGFEKPKSNADLDRIASSYQDIMNIIRISKSYQEQQYADSVITGNLDHIDSFSEDDEDHNLNNQLLQQSMKLSYEEKTYKDSNKNSKNPKTKATEEKGLKEKIYLTRTEDFVKAHGKNHNSEELENIFNTLNQVIKERKGILQNLKTIQVKMKDGRLLSYDIEKPHQSGKYQQVSFLIKGRAYLYDTLGIFERIYFKKNEDGSYEPFYIGHL